MNAQSNEQVGFDGLFERYVYWKALRFFARNPTREVYVNQLAGELGISTGMSSIVLRDLAKLGLVEMSARANAHFYSLADTYPTRAMKRFIALLDIQESGLVDHIIGSMDPSTVALYGSYAQGDQDELSDIDILVIGLVRKRPDMTRQMSSLDAEVNIQVFTPARWMKLKKARDPFYRAVIHDHVILAGGALP